MLSTYGTVCLYNPISFQSYSLNIWNGNYLDLNSLIKVGISIGFVNFGQINITNSDLSTSIFMLYSLKDVYLNYAHINTTAKTCRTNMGSGRGLIVQIQNDFCSSGSSGAGYGLMSE
jgi:hypothetical protein